MWTTIVRHVWLKQTIKSKCSHMTHKHSWTYNFQLTKVSHLFEGQLKSIHLLYWLIYSWHALLSNVSICQWPLQTKPPLQILPFQRIHRFGLIIHFLMLMIPNHWQWLPFVVKLHTRMDKVDTVAYHTCIGCLYLDSICDANY